VYRSRISRTDVTTMTVMNDLPVTIDFPRSFRLAPLRYRDVMAATLAAGAGAWLAIGAGVHAIVA
jgi:hypothetical protein